MDLILSEPEVVYVQKFLSNVRISFVAIVISVSNIGRAIKPYFSGRLQENFVPYQHIANQDAEGK